MCFLCTEPIMRHWMLPASLLSQVFFKRAGKKGGKKGRKKPLKFPPSSLSPLYPFWFNELLPALHKFYNAILAAIRTILAFRHSTGPSVSADGTFEQRHCVFSRLVSFILFSGLLGPNESTITEPFCDRYTGSNRVFHINVVFLRRECRDFKSLEWFPLEMMNRNFNRCDFRKKLAISNKLDRIFIRQ